MIYPLFSTAVRQEEGRDGKAATRRIRRGVVSHYRTGNARQDIFLNDVHCRDFLELVCRACDRYQWLCHAYCLMLHYHALIETRAATLLKGMKSSTAVTPRVSIGDISGWCMCSRAASRRSAPGAGHGLAIGQFRPAMGRGAGSVPAVCSTMSKGLHGHLILTCIVILVVF